MSEPQKAKPDDLGIPDFLRRKPGEKPTAAVEIKTTTVEIVEPWQQALSKLEPEKFREYIQQLINRGRFERRWLVVTEPYHTQRCVDLTLESFRMKFDEIAAKAEKRAEEMRDRVKVMREASPTFGLIPLRRILEELAKEGHAVRRGHAKAAVTEAKIEHVKFHWHDSPVTLARVKQVIREYVPPVKAKGGRGERPSFPDDAKIDFRGKNPKKEGSAPHARWKLLVEHSGRTVGAFLKAKGNPTTLRNAIQMGFVKLEGGTEAPKQKEEAEKCESTSSPKKTKPPARRSKTRSVKKSRKAASRRGRR